MVEERFLIRGSFMKRKVDRVTANHYLRLGIAFTVTFPLAIPNLSCHIRSAATTLDSWRCDYPDITAATTSSQHYGPAAVILDEVVQPVRRFHYQLLVHRLTTRKFLIRGSFMKRKVDRVTANHYLSLTASQEPSNIPFP